MSGRIPVVVAAVVAGLIGCDTASDRPATPAKPTKPDVAIDNGEFLSHQPFDADDWAALFASGGDLTHVELFEPTNPSTFDWSLAESASKLRWFRLESGGGDELAAALREAGSIEILNLPDANLSAKGLADLAAIDSLTQLRLGHVSIEPETARLFADAGHLQHLHLLDATIDRDTLAAFAECGSLQSFYADRVDAPDSAFAELQRARPDLHLHINLKHVPGHEHDE